MTSLELRGVSKTYRGGIVAAKAVDLATQSGELFVIVGPSGSGKSTLLRLVAGLEAVDSGSIHLEGRRIDGLAPRDRGLAMVFQDAVVYPHLNVFENIAFGLRARRVARGEIKARVTSTAETLGLGDALKRSPTTLSGGQKRRVTLARALVIQPELFLFDEPFSGLDAPLRASLRAEIAAMHRRTGATMILVTHDQGEALALADRLAVVDAGRVVQVGRPGEVYDAPRNQFVAQFLGQPPMAMIPCTVRVDGTGSVAVAVEPVGVKFGPWWVDHRSPSGLALADRSGGRVHLGLRPEHLVVSPVSMSGGMLAVATVDRLEPAGHETGATLRLGPHAISARLAPRTSVAVGNEVSLSVDLARACWFDSDTGERIG